MEIEITPQPEQHIFEDSLLMEEDATTGQRFLNFLIDVLVIRFGMSYLTTSLFVKLLIAIDPSVVYDLMAGGQHSFTVLFVGYLIGCLNTIIYYTFCEKAFRGYTLGKLVSGTRAIREDGGELTFANALLRSLSRIVPFEVFSAFGGHPWHDTWTLTRVIKTRR